MHRAHRPRPNVRRNLALGLLAGLAIGIGVAFGRHALDTKVRSEEDVKALSDRPLLAAIPMDKGTKGKPLSLVTDPHGMHAESIRRLRTNLLFVDVTTGKHSFVVTSAMPGEGKTTTVDQPGHGVGRYRRPRARSSTATCATPPSPGAWVWRAASV